MLMLLLLMNLDVLPSTLQPEAEMYAVWIILSAEVFATGMKINMAIVSSTTPVLAHRSKWFDDFWTLIPLVSPGQTRGLHCIGPIGLEIVNLSIFCDSTGITNHRRFILHNL